MERRCQCGFPIVHPDEALGCLECGRACCPACAVELESVWYCARCADALLGAPGR